jgi:ribosomal protein S12 methylthiotransferase
MGRRTSKDDITGIVKTLRDRIPDIALRTTLITGFPTETDEEHKELLEFIESMRFDRLGVFTYSKEEDTPAALLKPQIPAKVKKQRQKELMEIQQTIAFDISSSHIGRIMDVIIDGKIADKDDVYVARTYMDGPQVDGYIFINSEEELMSGDIIRVRVTGANKYDLIGEIVEGSVRK